jgi:hypothetical protein
MYIQHTLRFRGAFGEELQIPLNNLRHLNNWTKWWVWRLHSSWRSDGSPLWWVSSLTEWRHLHESSDSLTPPYSLQHLNKQTNNTPWNVRYVKSSCHARTSFLSHEAKKGKDKVAPIFPKEHSFLENLQSLTFLTLVNAACGWRWMWSIDGKILAEKKSKHSENN